LRAPEESKKGLSLKEEGQMLSDCPSSSKQL
jgi:hypothetical protein